MHLALRKSHWMRLISTPSSPTLHFYRYLKLFKMISIKCFLFFLTENGRGGPYLYLCVLCACIYMSLKREKARNYKRLLNQLSILSLSAGFACRVTSQISSTKLALHDAKDKEPLSNTMLFRWHQIHQVSYLVTEISGVQAR
ncbi:hypothetical protein SETIT_6G219000v2 [Setaria italica]|uniref:Uncharacterized protein n=1 Tax=Setaria italica TaxID=4555 RepID=A0A368RPH7_SETIT|nr:hypothetical protein SETIT_6G219000v2 [Setaria italica]